jgi:hypothetical protein
MDPDKGAHQHPRALHRKDYALRARASFVPRIQQSGKYARKYTVDDLLLHRVTLFRIAYGPRQRRRTNSLSPFSLRLN